MLLILERFLKKGIKGYELEIAEGQVEKHTVRMIDWTTAWPTVLYCLTGRILCNRQDNMLQMRRMLWTRDREGFKDVDETVLWRASTNSIREIKLREMIWVGHVASMEVVIIKTLSKKILKEKTTTKLCIDWTIVRKYVLLCRVSLTKTSADPNMPLGSRTSCMKH